MGNIAEYLRTLRTAVFGKDVRESIAKSIEQTYEDATRSGNANMEVSDARGYYSSLKNRLDGDKSDLQSQLNLERERIDNLASLEKGSTTGDAELIDIRTGQDGKNYNTAGDSMRNQIKNLNTRIDGSLEYNNSILKTNIEWQSGSIASNGYSQSNNKYIRNVGKIYALKGTTISLTDYSNNKSFVVARYANTDDDSFIERLTGQTSDYVLAESCYIRFAIYGGGQEQSDTSLSQIFNGKIYCEDNTLENIALYSRNCAVVMNNSTGYIKYNTSDKVLSLSQLKVIYISQKAPSVRYYSIATDNELQISLSSFDTQYCLIWMRIADSSVFATNNYPLNDPLNNVRINTQDYALLFAINKSSGEISGSVPIYYINNKKFGLDTSNIINNYISNYSSGDSSSMNAYNNLPNYYKKDENEYSHYLEDKIISIKKKSLPCLLFYTDSHYNSNAKHSFDLLEVLKNRCGIKDIVFGGDLLGQENTTKQAEYKMSDFMSEAFNRFGNSYKFVFGNHDKNVANIGDGATDEQVNEKALSYEFIYNQCIMPIENCIIREESEETENSEAWYRDQLHYFFDDTEKKIRVIVLDTGTTHDLIGNGGTPGRMRFQYDWLANVLMNTEKDYNVFVFCHQIYGSYDSTNARPTITGYGEWLSLILNGARTKAQVSFTDYSGKQYNYDFANCKNINIIGMFCGHSHMDYYEKVNNINSILTTCDAYNATHTHGPNMTQGTITEQAIDVISLDEGNRKCYIERIGAGESREFNY